MHCYPFTMFRQDAFKCLHSFQKYASLWYPSFCVLELNLIFPSNRSTDDFNGAQCKAVCVEAGMIALRREATVVTHEDFMDAILEVQAKKKQTLNYYA